MTICFGFPVDCIGAGWIHGHTRRMPPIGRILCLLLGENQSLSLGVLLGGNQILPLGVLLGGNQGVILSGLLGGNQSLSLGVLLGGNQSLYLGVLLGGNQGVSPSGPRACFRIPCRDARPRPLLALYPVG